jgi:hypothetical protein
MNFRQPMRKQTTRIELHNRSFGPQVGYDWCILLSTGCIPRPVVDRVNAPSIPDPVSQGSVSSVRDLARPALISGAD